MAEQRAPAAEQEGGDLPGWILGVEDGEREQGAADRPDEAVDGVPGAVEPGDLVGEELGDETDAGGGEYPWIGERAERLEMGGQGDPMRPHRHSGDEHAQVEPPTGEQADAGGEADELYGAHGSTCHGAWQAGKSKSGPAPKSRPRPRYATRGAAESAESGEAAAGA
jgi:hypothetical protein